MQNGGLAEMHKAAASQAIAKIADGFANPGRPADSCKAAPHIADVTRNIGNGELANFDKAVRVSGNLRPYVASATAVDFGLEPDDVRCMF